MSPRPSSRRLGSLSPNQALLASAVFAALATPATAQQQFDDLPGSELPANNDRTVAVALGDVDGDGDLDAVFGNQSYGGGQNRLLLNNGSGDFTDVTATQMPADTDQTNAVALDDVDGDGDLDMVIGNSQQNRLYLNDGSGTFTDATAAQMPIDTDATNAVALADVDGDGDLDIVAGNSSYAASQNRLYLNDGSGTFTDVTAAQMPVDTDTTNSVAMADIDGDGDLDMVLGNAGYSYLGQQNRLYLNDGAGTFTDVTGTQLPIDNTNTTEVVFGDVDGDGDADIVTANRGFSSGKYSAFGRQNRLYINDGSGTFTDFTSSQMALVIDRSEGLALGDVDGDNDLDIVVANTGFGFYGQGGMNGLMLNDGSGNFIDATMPRMSDDADPSMSLALGDIDADGDLDILIGNLPNYYATSSSKLYLNLNGQLHAPDPFAIGQTYTLEGYLRYGPASVSDFALPYISPNLGSVQLPPYGTIGIDPGSMVPLPLFTIPQPAGVGSVSIAVPIIPGLLGISFHSQALLVPAPFTGTLSNVVSDEFVPLPPPVLTDIVPAVAAAGTSVTVNGTNFLNGVTLTVGGNPTPITSWTATTVDFVMPPGNNCDTLVEVANLVNSSDSLMMNITPTITAVPTITGPAVGGTAFTVEGTDLLGATVTFNGAPLANIQTTATTVTGDTPAGLVGPAAVIVANANGCQATTVTIFTYHAIPEITSIQPAVANAGVPVTVHGNNFLNGVTLMVGNNPTAITAWTPTTVSFVMPAGLSCDALVEITNLGTITASATMNNSPIVTSHALGGPAAGGGLFFVIGSHLLGATITFNGTPMTNITTNTFGAIVGYAPPGTPGPATVVISNGNGCQTTITYTYQ